jgi:SpoVK/Ycf46/Vps4 family AAA+-type ATPase
METYLQKITGDNTWDDLGVSKVTLDRLQYIGAQIKPGVSVRILFTGPPGTGKTLSAKILGNEMGMELYRVDLAAVISKYIGETEKNLSALFEHGQALDIVLLFDEADALFGKRSSVKDSDDRYGNLDTNYLLQKIEDYPGVVVLTSNSRDAFADTFIRRMTWDVDFTSAMPKQPLPWWRRVLIWFGFK